MTTGTYLLKCNGWSDKKRGQVGERHRWSGPGWGKGWCVWCHRCLYQLVVKDEPTTSVPRTQSAPKKSLKALRAGAGGRPRAGRSPQ